MISIGMTLTSDPKLNHGLECKDLFKENPFIVRLEQKGVQILKNPVTSTNKCGEEWRVYGTCCGVNSLIQYAQKDSKEIFDSVRDSLKVLIKSINTFSELFTNVDYLRKRRRIDLSLGEQKLIKATSKPNLADLIQMIDSFKETNGHNDERNLIKEYTKCWDHITQIRSASLCSTCSARSHIFFLGKKAVIDAPTCNSILNKCSVTFTTIITFIRGLDRLANNMLLVFTRWRKGRDWVKKMDQVTEELKRNKIGELLHLYYDDGSQKDSSVNKSRLQIRLCGKLVKIGSKPFISDLKVLLNRYNFGLLQDFSDNLEEYVVNDQKYEKKIRSIMEVEKRRSKPSRLLQWVIGSNTQNSQKSKTGNWEDPALNHGNTTGFNSQTEIFIPDNIFEGDVEVIDNKMILNIDSSYTSYQGAIGTKGNEAHKIYKDIKPMNITSVFP